jgi:hypothetical protein
MDYSHPTIEILLKKFKPIIGQDYDRYKNHVYRVFSNCLLIDHSKDNEEKYAIATVFHDIGIWTDHTLDYLEPSIEQAKTYLTDIGKEAWIEEIALMIDWHHKITQYHGKHEQIVENFRKADWIDVSLGIMTFGFDKQRIRETRKKLPNLGFHAFLIKGTFRNLFIHPLNPLPMFRK